MTPITQLAAFVFIATHCMAQQSSPQQSPSQQSPSQQGQRYTIAVKPAATAHGTTLKIGEICDITPVDQSSLAIASLDFGPCPVPGHVRRITRTQLLQSLAVAGYSPGAFVFRGAIEASASTATLDISSAAIAESATTALRGLLDHEGGDVEISLAGRVQALRAPSGRVSQELRARVRRDSSQLTAATVDVSVLVDDEVYKTVQVRFKLARFHEVLEATGTIAKGTPLGPHNLRLVRRSVVSTRGLYLTDLSEVAGKIAERNLPNGRLIMLADTGLPAVIRRGDICEVVVQSGRILARIQAVANSDAALGESLTLTNARSHNQILAVAKAPGLAVVPTLN